MCVLCNRDQHEKEGTLGLWGDRREFSVSVRNVSQKTHRIAEKDLVPVFVR